MNQAVVARVALALGALFVAAASMFAWLVSEPLASPSAASSAASRPGEALFGTYCGTCHEVAEVEGMLRSGGSNLDANVAAMLRVLAKHGKSDDGQDRLIVEFIANRVE